MRGKARGVRGEKVSSRGCDGDECMAVESKIAQQGTDVCGETLQPWQRRRKDWKAPGQFFWGEADVIIWNRSMMESLFYDCGPDLFAKRFCY